MPLDEHEIEYRLKTLEEDSRRNQTTHKEMFERFEKLGQEYARIDAQYANILTTLAKLETSLEELKSKPAKRWDAVIASVITGVVGFVVAWILNGNI